MYRKAVALGIAVVVIAAAVGYLHPMLLRFVGRFQAASARMPIPDRILQIAFDPQDHALSCEVAVLKMALAYRSISVDEAELIGAVGVDTTPKTRDAGGTVWGDPQLGFVGDIDGKMLRDGYGVYWGPIARAARAYRPATAFEGWTAADIARQIGEGNPVVVWGYLGPGTTYRWTTPAGRVVSGVNREHAFLVNGYTGSADAPTGLFLIDPIYGPRYDTLDSFMELVRPFNGSGVVIR